MTESAANAAAQTDTQKEQARIMAAIQRRVADQDAHWRAGDERTA